MWIDDNLPTGLGIDVLATPTSAADLEYVTALDELVPALARKLDDLVGVRLCEAIDHSARVVSTHLDSELRRQVTDLQARQSSAFERIERSLERISSAAPAEEDR